MAQLPNNVCILPNLKPNEFKLEQLNDEQGYMLGKLPDEFIQELEKVELGTSTIANDLAGNIAHENKIELTSKFKDYIIKLAHSLADTSPYLELLYSQMCDGFRHNYVIQNTWLNRQKKYDFQPSHDHSGAFSFVIWHKIPYDVEEELRYYPNTNSSLASLFGFQFVSGKNLKNMHFKIGKEHENYICVFPADLHHIVYPFYTSDDYRVTISGNISIVPCPPKN